MKNAYLVVEGPHDVAFVVAILRRRWGFEERRIFKDLPPLSALLVPKGFPSNPEGDIQVRVDVPSVLVSPDWHVIVHAANGDSKLIGRLKQTLNAVKNKPEHRLDAVGIVLDSDKRVQPADRFQRFAAELPALSLSVPSAPGVSTPGTPRVSVFVLPDNLRQGTLEDVLLDLSTVVYPDLAALASGFTRDADPVMAKLPSRDRGEFSAPSGRQKAQVAAVANLLKPGKSVAASITDNRWICEDTLSHGALAPFVTFLRELLDLPAEAA